MRLRGLLATANATAHEVGAAAVRTGDTMRAATGALIAVALVAVVALVLSVIAVSRTR